MEAIASKDLVAAFLDDLCRQYSPAATTSPPRSTPESMPVILAPEDTPHPEGLAIRESAKAFLIDGAGSGDRSHTLQGVTVALYCAGLTDEEVLSVLANSDAAMDVALDHRQQDHDRAMAYLWKHCLDAKPKALRSMATDEDFDALTVDTQEGNQDNFLAAITLEELAAARTSPRVLVPHLLYACVRSRIAAGGVGKTTMVLYEAATLALCRELWGRTPEGPLRTVIVTREDDRELLVGRLREIMKAMHLTDGERDTVLRHVRIMDLTGQPFRLTTIEKDMVKPDTRAMKWLLDKLQDFQPDWVIFDPLVSFGTGEARVNDSEQGLIEAARIIKRSLECCVELVHHTGKQNSRDGSLDQYANRGGSALPDGSRMVAVLQPLEADEWLKQTGTALADGQTGLVMGLPKLSYAPKQEPVYILRDGFAYRHVLAKHQTPDDITEIRANKVHEFLSTEYKAGRKYNQTDLCHCTEETGLSRDQIRAAISYLKARGRIVREGAERAKGTFIMPVTVADSTFVEDHPDIASAEAF